MKRDDNLGRISREVYGDAGRWPEIIDANRHLLEDPDSVVSQYDVGDSLIVGSRIPSALGTGPPFTLCYRRMNRKNNALMTRGSMEKFSPNPPTVRERRSRIRIQYQHGMSLTEFTEQFGIEAKCEAALERVRWPLGFSLPRVQRARALTVS